MPSSRVTSQSRDQTCIFYISYIGRQIFYHWAIRKPSPVWPHLNLFTLGKTVSIKVTFTGSGYTWIGVCIGHYSVKHVTQKIAKKNSRSVVQIFYLGVTVTENNIWFGVFEDLILTMYILKAGRVMWRPLEEEGENVLGIKSRSNNSFSIHLLMEFHISKHS